MTVELVLLEGLVKQIEAQRDHLYQSLLKVMKDLEDEKNKTNQLFTLIEDIEKQYKAINYMTVENAKLIVKNQIISEDVDLVLKLLDDLKPKGSEFFGKKKYHG